MLKDNDLRQIEKKGITPEKIEEQLRNFKTGFPFAKLVAPATKKKGIRLFTADEISGLEETYNRLATEKRIMKFVPASGAATRMFKHLFEFRSLPAEKKQIPLEECTDKGFDSVYNFFKSINNFAFADELFESIAEAGYSVEELLATFNYDEILDHLLTEKGLNYGNLPKGLIKFHHYGNFSRTSVGEHLVEGAHYSRNKEDIVNIHFTVSPEHRKGFNDLMDSVLPYYSEKFSVRYGVSFSEQKPSTDTIAVDMDNEPFRDETGDLLFRPGGHGALIENLNDLDSDIVFIKNIDNVVPDHLKPQTYLYKKVIGGLLMRLTDKIHGFLKEIETGTVTEDRMDEMERFITYELGLETGRRLDSNEREVKIKAIRDMLNRPVRVCGMVKNEGEPGGGPFWVENDKGYVSLQIVESSQIDPDDKLQQELLVKATHFNPVDLVCSIKDHRGKKFNLKDFVDPSTGFISIKSRNGEKIKAQELPGLWNGAMAGWITVFVEVPIITFNPVKTVNDLLRQQHQPLGNSK
jgi:hypothetical protein